MCSLTRLSFLKRADSLAKTGQTHKHTLVATCDRHTGARSLGVDFDVWFSWQEVVINCPRSRFSAVIGQFPETVQKPPPTSALACHRGYLSSMACQLPLTWDVTNYSRAHTHTHQLPVWERLKTPVKAFLTFSSCVFFIIFLILALFLVLSVPRWGQQITEKHPRPPVLQSRLVSLLSLCDVFWQWGTQDRYILSALTQESTMAH